MSASVFLLRIFKGLGIVIVLFFVLGHWAGTLNPAKHFISQYATSAPWAWMILGCMMLLGVAYWFLAFGIIKFFHHSNAAALAAIALSISGALLFLVALYPTWTVGDTKFQSLNILERAKIFLSPDRLNKEIDRAHRDKVAAIHDQMIQFSIGGLLLSQTALAIALVREEKRTRLGVLTIILMASALAAFSLSEVFKDTVGGLWQRLGFGFVLVWVWGVGRNFLIPRLASDAPLARHSVTRQAPPDESGTPGLF